ncbi:MAG: hypothetical protein HY234_06405 [Acidobacteria bacterium]|nr:hypothetical protein [Acidobacteriota bacterium]MBI3662665.1 hypothetical protein [Acidobacteriota bacterium]
MKRLSYIALVILAIVTLASTGWAQKAGVIGTHHDVGGNGCKSCHAPHNGSVATGGASQATGKILLWDRDFTTQTFGTYSSPTLNNATTEVGASAPTATDPRLYSFLCMSCHDGVTTPSVIGPTKDEAVGNPTNSFGLQNDHPVNMNYDPTQDSGLAAIASVTAAGLKLYGASNTVQCASCHNVHNDSISPFLRKSNAGSALCVACHT